MHVSTTNIFLVFAAILLLSFQFAAVTSASPSPFALPEAEGDGFMLLEAREPKSGRKTGTAGSSGNSTEEDDEDNSGASIKVPALALVAALGFAVGMM